MAIAAPVAAAAALVLVVFIVFAYVFLWANAAKAPLSKLPFNAGAPVISLLDLMIHAAKGFADVVEVPLLGLVFKLRAALGGGMSVVFHVLVAPLHAWTALLQMEHDALFSLATLVIHPLAIATKREHDALYSDVEGRLSPALALLVREHDALFALVTEVIHPLAIATKREHDALFSDVEGRISPGLGLITREHDALYRWVFEHVPVVELRQSALADELRVTEGLLDGARADLARVLPLAVIVAAGAVAIENALRVARDPCFCLTQGALSDLPDRVASLEGMGS